MCSHVEGFHPICGWDMGMKEKSANDVINGAEHAFGFPILLGGVRAWKSKFNFVG